MPLSEELEQEHRQIDQGIEPFASTAPASADEAQRTALADALDELRRHIYFEEELLFPPLQEAGLVPPLFVMRREHGELWVTMDALADALSNARPSETGPSSVQELARQLLAQLEAHNGKEESVVYASADAMIPASVQDRLSAELESVHLPDQWVCEAARS